MLSAARHYQSANAALEIRFRSRGTLDRHTTHAPSFIDGDILQTKPRGFLATGAMIVRRETPLALYKGLGAVLSGIVPKMAVRFASFEQYKGWLADKDTGKTSVGNIFIGQCSS